MEIIDDMNSELSCRRREVPPAAALVGTVTRVGYYGDSLPKLIITVKKTEASGMLCSWRGKGSVSLYYQRQNLCGRCQDNPAVGYGKGVS